MHVVIGCDLSDGGDAAVVAGHALALRDGATHLIVVHVVTQQDLDQTGQLGADEKKRVALEHAYPAVWKRVQRVLEGVDETEIETDVEVRFAAVHLVRSQERIAHEILQVAVDHGAVFVVLGRRGRPGSVAEHILAHADLAEAPEGAPPHAIVARVDAAASGLQRSLAYEHKPS